MDSKFKKIIIGTALASTVFTATITPIFANSTHRVVSGDTLWKVSQQHKVSLEEIYKLNPQYRNNSNVEVGDIINLSQTTYTVQKNDTPWIISNKFKVSLEEFLKVNGLKEGQHIYPGQKVVIPTVSSTNNTTTYTVQKSDTPWIISNKFKVSLEEFLKVNGLKEGQDIYPGQVVSIPSASQPTSTPTVSRGSTSSPRITYINHTVASGDDLWSIGIKYGIPMTELQKLNGFSSSHVLRIGDQVRIPVYNIPIKQTPGSQFGELLDWWTEAQYVVPIEKTFIVEDFYTGKRWNMKRTIGANHADVEPVSASDTAIMKGVWGGSWSWAVRPVIVEVNGRRLAASASAMPHDVQNITNNNFNGHSDLYFLNSTRHKDGLKDQNHQNAIVVAAGQKK
ncbi:LysM repeat-containing protein [Anaerovirgula multivorans]|uniref:LysM repeat-containing protein n=1 Tax=Anaerovirgula multivorans TaxID=312168 RepID=A0A239BPN9_9FIRM|nr:LysM peptidoglycan-binding domain-containing protein [Anaerovirgula multivorans]SNS09321.1 LysM repeat-containing protein [Anaerovirgula multivorans]